MNGKVALITGISGQDGAYLSKLLLHKGYKVVGLVRSSIESDLFGLNYLGIRDKITIEQCDLLDITQIIKVLSNAEPDEIYNLAAQSSVSQSFEQPIGTISFNTLSVLNILEAIRMVNKHVKLYHASSSEMFGKLKHLPLTEDTEFHPTSPYAVSKAAAHWSCVNYRESYGLFICCGILFNHESFLRKRNFFVKKVISSALDIKQGKKEYLQVGNIDIYRDFGYAPRYVEAMYLMMQQTDPSNYLICSGKSVSLRYIINYVFEKFDIDISRLTVSKDLYRPSEIENIFGDPGKAKAELNWKYDMSIEQVLDQLVVEEILNYNLTD